MTGKKKLKKKNTWRLNDLLLNNQQVTEGIKKEINKWQWKHDDPKPMEHSKRGKFIAIQAYVKKWEKHHKQSDFTPKANRKRRTKQQTKTKNPTKLVGQK